MQTKAQQITKGTEDANVFSFATGGISGSQPSIRVQIPVPSLSGYDFSYFTSLSLASSLSLLSWAAVSIVVDNSR